MANFLGPVVRQQAWELGDVAPGAVLKFYLSGTSTPQAVFTPAGVSLGTTLTADSTGRFAAFTLAPVAYRIEMLASDGSTIWPAQDNVTNPASLTPGGSTGQVQFNNAGAFGGDSGLTFNAGANALTVGGLLTVGGGITAAASVQVTGGVTVSTVFTDADGQLYAPVVTPFTPVLGGAGGTSGQSYSYQVGRAIKIGPLVMATVSLALSAKGTITGSCQIQGFPYTAVTSATLGWPAVVLFLQLGTTWVTVTGQIGSNTTVMPLVGATVAATANNTALTTADITNTTQLNATVMYETDV